MYSDPARGLTKSIKAKKASQPKPPPRALPLGDITLLCTLLYAVPRTSVFGAILLTGYMGGAIYTHLRVGSPLFSHTLFGVYLSLFIWGGLWLRDASVRALIPFRR